MKRKLVLLLTMLFAIIMLPQLIKAKNVDKYVKDGKIVFKSVKPKNNDEMYVFFENLFYVNFDGPGFYVDPGTCNADYTKCTFLEGENDSIKTELEIEYEYDENIKSIVDNLVSKLPANKDTYNLTEMELISYILNDKNGIGSIADFSGELKKYIEYKNFGIDVRLGDDSSFYTMRGGNALFTYNGTRTELGSEYLLNKDTVFKYLWKDVNNNNNSNSNTTPLPDKGEPVPKTFDSITIYITLFVISIIGLTSVVIINKKSD